MRLYNDLPFEIYDKDGSLIASFYSKNDMLSCIPVLQERHKNKEFHTRDTFFYDNDYEKDTPEVDSEV